LVTITNKSPKNVVSLHSRSALRSQWLIPLRYISRRLRPPLSPPQHSCVGGPKKKQNTMVLTLIRNPTQGEALRGQLYIDGEPICPTMERQSVAIPPLWYHVAVTESPKFKRLLPLIERVPQRSGIRIHVGTQPQHSSGCILVPNRKIEDLITQRILTAQHQREEIRMEIK